MKRYVWIVNPTVNNCYFIIALVAVSVLVTEGNVPGNVSISECPQSGGQAQRQGHIPDDGQPVKFTCENIPINEAVFWILRPNSTVTLSLKCDPPSQPCNTTHPDFQVSRGNETSVLTVVQNHQRWLVTGTVICYVGDGSSNVYTCNVKFASTAVTTHGTATTAQTSTDGEGNEEKDDGLPIAAIAGGAAAFLVIIIIIIVVVVVVRRRKRQKKAHADNNVLEEHANPMYGSGDEPETASPSNSKPSGIALRIPTDTSNNVATIEDADNTIDAGYSSMAFGEQQTTSPASATSPTGQSSPNTDSQPGFPMNTTTPVVVTDADLYTSVDGMEQEQSSGPVQDHAGGYSTVGGPNNSATAAPSGDVYSVVQKSGPRAQSTTATTTVSPNNPGDSADGAYAFVDVSRSSASAPSSKTPSGDLVSDNADNTYAVVNKSSSQGKGIGASDSPDTSNSTRQAPSGDVYAQVDNISKPNRSTPEHDDEGQSNVYAQVDKTSKGNNSTPVQQTQAQDQKPGIKPKPALKPKPSSNV
ncbi:uncharacterized protein [Littorina saxatilis]|uniref:uncharacterized protein isoform X2 n=1 Tax=Littorina saxatilis TaxID=31220 RepID=UPI0038B69016